MKDLHVSTPYRRAGTDEDAEVVRRIRNEGRSWFGDDKYISPEDQRAWWGANKERVLIVLVGAPPVGYGMIVPREGRSWISLAVTEQQRGRGWGRQIYELVAQISEEPIYAAIRRDNRGSIIAAERAGYVAASCDPPGISVESRNDWVVLWHPAPR